MSSQSEHPRRKTQRITLIIRYTNVHSLADIPEHRIEPLLKLHQRITELDLATTRQINACKLLDPSYTKEVNPLMGFINATAVDENEFLTKLNEVNLWITEQMHIASKLENDANSRRRPRSPSDDEKLLMLRRKTMASSSAASSSNAFSSLQKETYFCVNCMSYYDYKDYFTACKEGHHICKNCFHGRVRICMGLHVTEDRKDTAFMRMDTNKLGGVSRPGQMGCTNFYANTCKDGFMQEYHIVQWIAEQDPTTVDRAMKIIKAAAMSDAQIILDKKKEEEARFNSSKPDP